MEFSEAEARYLAERGLGRLATVRADGSPQVQPVAFWFDAGSGTVDIGGPDLEGSQKYRNVVGDPRVSFVVDDTAPEPNPIGQAGRGIELRGTAEIVTLDTPLVPGFSHEALRIRAHRVIAWNLEPWTDEDVTRANGGEATHLTGYRARDLPAR